MESTPENTINKTPNPQASLEVALKGLAMRTKAIAGNIANVSTPNYKSRFVEFEETLKKVQGDKKLSDIPMSKTNDKHFTNDIYSFDEAEKAIEMKVTEDDYFLNGNNVHIENEMMELNKTALRYKALAQLAKKQYDGLRTVIRG